MEYQHDDLAAGRWSAFSLAEQLGNIGSEVARAVSWRERGNKEYFEKSFSRMLELLDLTLADERWRGAKRKEIARVREALCDSFEESPWLGVPLSSWSRYFLPFAIMARSQRGLLINNDTSFRR